MRSNSSYIAKGIIQINGDSKPYQVKGLYKLAIDRMLLYFVTIDGVQSVYLLENPKNSFYAFNPNSMESYVFIKIPCN
jgi:hypothetical protein